MFDMEEFAGKLYERYCQTVGGKAYDGQPLPSWKEFRADESKRVQSNAWIEVAEAAWERLTAPWPGWTKPERTRCNPKANR